VNLPDFMTRARREFIDSAVFFDFFGGMVVGWSVVVVVVLVVVREFVLLSLMIRDC
jgi:hypothetical protein